MEQSFWAFLVLCALLTITPGADTALVLKSSLVGGRRAFTATILGICAGLLFHAAMSSLGLSAILKTSAELYSGVKLVGACYLIYLGARAIYEAWRKTPIAVDSSGELGSAETPAIRSVNAFAEFRVGLFTNILNPKVAIFYLTFLPQFVDPSRGVFLQSVLLSLVHIALSFVWLMMIGYFVSYFRAQLSKPSVRRSVESLTGLALLAFGIKLATQR